MGFKVKLISVIIPFHKEIDLIGRAVESVFRQICFESGIRVEIIIGNDGNISQSDIRAAIPVPRQNCNIIITNNTGVKGPGGARNCAIRASSGDYFAFLDSDDVWLDGKLAAQVNLFESGADFVATGYRFNNSSKVISPPDPQERRIDVFRDLGILTSSVMVRACLLKNNAFRDLRFSQDIDLWYRILRSPNVEYRSLSEPYVVYSKGGSSRNKFEQARSLWDVMTLNKIPPTNKIKCIMLYAARGLKNHVFSF